jgi:hypothetical protein
MTAIPPINTTERLFTDGQIEAGLAWMDAADPRCPYCGGGMFQSGWGWFCETAGVLLDPPEEAELGGKS